MSKAAIMILEHAWSSNASVIEYMALDNPRLDIILRNNEEIQSAIDKLKNNERPVITPHVKAVAYKFKHLTKDEMNNMDRLSKKDIYYAIDIMLTKIYGKTN